MSNFIEPSKLEALPSKFKAHRFCVAPMLDWMDNLYFAL